MYLNIVYSVSGINCDRCVRECSGCNFKSRQWTLWKLTPFAEVIRVIKLSSPVSVVRPPLSPRCFKFILIAVLSNFQVVVGGCCRGGGVWGWLRDCDVHPTLLLREHFNSESGTMRSARPLFCSCIKISGPKNERKALV